MPRRGRRLAGCRPYPAPETEAARHLGQAFLANHRHLALRQSAFGVLGEALDQQVGHDQAKDPVAQELQALVGARPLPRPPRTLLWVSASVEPGAIAEAIAQSQLELVQVRRDWLGARCALAASSPIARRRYWMTLSRRP